MKYDQKFINKETENFTVSKALKGITLASVKSIGSESEATEELYSVENFRQISSDKFSAVVDGVEHFFNNAGECVDAPDTVGALAFVSSDIQKSTQNTADADNTGTSETLKTTATISSLSPRDYFAQEIMNAFMKGINNPFSLSDADIYKYTTLSYKIAQSMINVAAFNRKGDPQSGSVDPSAEVVIDKATLNGNTEKLLNNIVAALDKTNAEITVGTEVGLKAERITIPEINALMNDYVTGATAGTKVGLKDLISAISATNFTTLLTNLNTALTTLTTTLNTALSTNIGTTRTANIGGSGLGRDSSHPLYISGMSSGSSLPADPENTLPNATANQIQYLLAYSTSNNWSRTNIASAVDARIKQFAADLKTANPSLNITIPSNWTT